MYSTITGQRSRLLARKNGRRLAARFPQPCARGPNQAPTKTDVPVPSALRERDPLPPAKGSGLVQVRPLPHGGRGVTTEGTALEQL
jgi:hypothetical protein